jgi:hypothetical protein
LLIELLRILVLTRRLAMPHCPMSRGWVVEQLLIELLRILVITRMPVVPCLLLCCLCVFRLSRRLLGARLCARPKPRSRRRWKLLASSAQRRMWSASCRRRAPRLRDLRPPRPRRLRSRRDRPAPRARLLSTPSGSVGRWSLRQNRAPRGRTRTDGRTDGLHCPL